MEYWLQKKTIGGWSMVTWYATIEEALKNYQSCLTSGKGYSWRLCKVEVVEASMLDEVVEVAAPELPEPVFIKTKPPQIINQTDWTGVASTWGEKRTTDDPSPGAVVSTRPPRLDLIGSVWLVHHGLKKKTRVASHLVESMLAQGYEKGSPRTVFRG